MGLDRKFLRGLPLAMADELIEKYGLHGSWPVQLAPLYDALSIRIYHDIILPEGFPAFSAIHARLGHGIAVFTAGLEGASLAQVMGHEMGHLLCHKTGRPHGCITSPGGIVPKEEQEADYLASYLMVPGQAFYEMCRAGYNFDEIATLLNVPRTMLQMRADIMVARDEFGVVSHPFNVNLD